MSIQDFYRVQDPKVTTKTGVWTQIAYYPYDDRFVLTEWAPYLPSDPYPAGSYVRKADAEKAARQFRTGADRKVKSGYKIVDLREGV